MVLVVKDSVGICHEIRERHSKEWGIFERKNEEKTRGFSWNLPIYNNLGRSADDTKKLSVTWIVSYVVVYLPSDESICTLWVNLCKHKVWIKVCGLKRRVRYQGSKVLFLYFGFYNLNFSSIAWQDALKYCRKVKAKDLLTIVIFKCLNMCNNWKLVALSISQPIRDSNICWHSIFNTLIINRQIIRENYDD